MRILFLLISTISTLSAVFTPFDPEEVTDGYVLAEFALDLQIDPSTGEILTCMPVLIFTDYMLEFNLAAGTIISYSTDPRQMRSTLPSLEALKNEYREGNWFKISIGPRKLKSFKLFLPREYMGPVQTTGQTIGAQIWESATPDQMVALMQYVSIALKRLKLLDTKFTFYLNNIGLQGMIPTPTRMVETVIKPSKELIKTCQYDDSVPTNPIILDEIDITIQPPTAKPFSLVTETKKAFSRVKSWFGW
jgi:hypothetical protein